MVSARGLDAYKRFFNAMPTDSGLGFVLIPHLDPNHESLMVELLARHTTMTVTEARNGTIVKQNSVYIIPPNKYLAITDGVLQLSRPPEVPGVHVAIDFFFRSLADDLQDKAIGIILSGTGSHGTTGLQAIKASGGLAMVQDPLSTEYRQIPQSAIDIGIADCILTPETMPETLIKYVRRAFESGAWQADAYPDAISKELGSVLTLLRARTKYDFRSYRKNMLVRRVQRRMGLNQIDKTSDYLELLRENADEVKNLLRDMLIGVTGFFREPEAYQVLEQRVIPQLVESKDADTPVRIWVPGCASGEEAYSIAMLLIEQFSAENKLLNMQIFATDINENALEIARLGIYPESIATDIPAERLQRFFTRKDSHFHINKQLRESVVFAPQSLINDAPFSKLDIISCRNLLIYLGPEMQQKVHSLFHFALNENGILFIGSSETVGRQADMYETVSKKWRIFRKIGPTRGDVINFSIVPGDLRHGFINHMEQASRHAVNFAELTHRQLLEDYAPASVLINRKLEILYFHGSTGLFLEQPGGEPTRDLIAMARLGLRTKLRTACHRAIRDNQLTRDDDARGKRNDTWNSCTITVKPIDEPKGAEGLLLITFLEHKNLPPVAAEPSVETKNDPQIDPGEESSLVFQMENELKSNCEELQTTIEEMESSNEELKASNEEIMSMNEELQSVNEELETSKEELLSMNEELITVNNQLEDKVNELVSSRDDLANTLNSTDIATLFLDNDMRIRQFTPATGKLLGLIASDTGRPINTFATPLTSEDLLADARLVLDNLQPVAAEVRTNTTGGLRDENSEPQVPWRNEDATSYGSRTSTFDSAHSRCYLRRILPFRTADNRIEGVVISFVDITQSKQIETDEREVRRLRQLVENLPAGSVYVEHDQLIMNRAAEEITGYKRDELTTLNDWFSSLYGERAAHMRQIYDSNRKAGFPRQTAPIALTRKDGQQRFVVFSSYKFDDHDVWIMHDVTQRQRMEQELRESEERLSAILNTAGDAIITIDSRGIINSVNPATGQFFGYTKEELIGANVSVLMPQPYRDNHDGYLARYLETGEAHVIGIGREVAGKRKDGSTFPVSLSISEVTDMGLFTGVIRDISESRDLQKQVLGIAAEESRRIGQELHDGIQQELTGLELFAGTLVKTLDTEERTELEGKETRHLEKAGVLTLREIADKLRCGLAETCKNVQYLSRGILPVEIDALGLNTALAELASSTDGQQDFSCQFDSGGIVEVPDNTIATHLYRIAQEAVNNALRHSQGDEIQISLTRQDDQITLIVCDNGVGVGPAIKNRDAISRETTALGFRAMNYRAGLIGGTLDIGRRAGGGTEVICTVLPGIMYGGFPQDRRKTGF